MCVAIVPKQCSSNQSLIERKFYRKESLFEVVDKSLFAEECNKFAKI
jgi:hypothetical protein